jgi:hypothetical protein
MNKFVLFSGPSGNAFRLSGDLLRDAPDFPVQLKIERPYKLFYRAIDDNFPGLEGCGSEWRLAVHALAEKIEASLADTDDAKRERVILDYVIFLRSAANESWKPWAERHINKILGLKKPSSA